MRRRWVDEAKLPAEVVAARKVPKLFVKPAEYDMAAWLIGQRDFKRAEKLLLEAMDVQVGCIG